MKMPPPPGLVKADLVSKLVQHLLQPQDRSTQHARAAHVERSLRFHSFPATNEHRVAESFMGLIEKFDLYGQQEKAHELEALFNKANQLVGTTSRVKKIALYDALALLLHMSLAPLKSSYQARKSYEENSSVSLTWEDILREEPLEGDHWRPVRQEGRTRWSRWDSEDSNWSEDDEAGEIDRASAVDVEEVAPVPGLVVEDSHLPDQLPQTSFRVDHADAEKSAKAMYWDPNRPQRSVPSEDHHFKASEPTSLMPSLAVKQSSEPSFFGVPAFSTNFVSELDVILESIHVLFGLPADLYDLDSSGCYSVRGTASLKHLSEGTLHSIMDRFCAWGNLIVRLQRFAKSTLKERTLVLEAFASVTEKRLDRFFEWLSNLERQYMNIMCEDSGKGGIGVLQTVSLIQLAELVRCKIDLLMPLDSVILEVGFANSQKHPSTLLLDRLWAELGVYQHACDAHMFINLLLVLFETMRPWIDRIEDWFLSNEIVDLFNELPIVFHPNVRKNYWTESYSICNERLPQILSANMDAIARIGKGLHILHELYPSMCSDCLGEESRTSLHQRLFLAVQKHFHLASVASSDDTSAPLTSAQSSAGIAPELELLLFESMEIADAPEAIKIVSMAEISKDEEPIFREDYEQVLLPLTQTWDLALSSALLPLDKSVGKCVLQQMFSSSQLELHLRVIKDFFLLGQGSVMTSFCDALMELDQNVWKRPTAVQHSFLAALLADGASFDGLDVTDTVRFRVASNNEQPTGLPLIECLKISYDAPWPINTIITPPLLDHYCNVMVFVLQILWTKRRMAQVASLGQHRRLPKEFTKTRAFRFQTLLKRRMDVFCESLHHFCMVAVVEQEYQRFLVSIKGSADLGEAIRIHEKFAVSLVELLLIDEKVCAPLFRNIFRPSRKDHSPEKCDPGMPGSVRAICRRLGQVYHQPRAIRRQHWCKRKGQCFSSWDKPKASSAAAGAASASHQERAKTWTFT
ncbi:Spc98 family-domain-containing protein [Zopfochytrium polystomum]|nr:Spc98 family-domain-containing protein [Zopfochytrium polystomum]